MTNLQKAINEFCGASHDLDFHADDRERCAILADALEEIKGRLNDLDDDKIQHQTAFRDLHQRLDALMGKDVPPTAEHTTFEPWDCVKAKPETRLHEKWGDDELTLGFGPDNDGEYRVFNPEAENYSVGYAKLEELIFVRRLKPRAQEPLFKVGDWVCNQTYGHTFQVTQIEGDWLYGAIREKRVRAHINQSTKVDKPTPFQVGDWVQDGRNGPVFKLERVGPVCYGYDQAGTAWENEAHRLHKVDPPAPRFTFGQRVMLHDHGPYIVLGETDVKRVYDLISIPKHTFTAHETDLTPLDTDAD